MLTTQLELPNLHNSKTCGGHEGSISTTIFKKCVVITIFTIYFTIYYYIYILYFHIIIILIEDLPKGISLTVHQSLCRLH